MNLTFGNNSTTWNLVSILAVLALAGALIFDWFAPTPDPALAKLKLQKERTKLETELKSKRKEMESIQKTVANKLWSEKAEEVTPKIMTEANKIADQVGVKIKSFRPQRTLTGAGLERLTYTALVEGEYQKVVQLAHKFDEPSNQFSVYMIQIAAADGNSDQVNATISIVAYAKSDIEE